MALDFRAVMTHQAYYLRAVGGFASERFGMRGRDFSAGMRVYDISTPAAPRAIGFMPVEGLGIHCIWWVGGRYAYASALLDGYTDYILIVIDWLNPRARRSSAAGRCPACGLRAARQTRRTTGSACITRWSPTTRPTVAGATAA